MRVRKVLETLARGVPVARRSRGVSIAAVSPGAYSVATVTVDDLAELLPLMRSYCDFYETAPSDGALRELARVLLAGGDCEGVQLIARDRGAHAVGFATLYWSWDTTEASPIAIMHDLFVAPAARGAGLAERLIEACVERCRQRGAVRLDWQTAADNARAQAVYDRVGGVRGGWLSYSLSTR